MKYNLTGDEEKYLNSRRELEPSIIENDPEMLSWEIQNIKTIQDAASNGAHSIMFYPASGYDGLRCIIAYDLDHIITADLNDFSIREYLDKMRISYIKNDSDDGITKETLFSLNGRQRRATELKMDARDVNLSEILGPESNGTIDVLHIYAPTGIENIEKCDEKTGEWTLVREGIVSRLDAKNYNMINLNGFLCIDERPIGLGFGGNYRSFIPESFFEMIGLKEHKVIERHPYSVCTSMYPDKDEMKQHGGVIYQKVKDVGFRASLELASLAQYLWFFAYGLDRIMYGDFDVYLLPFEDDPDIRVDEILTSGDKEKEKEFTRNYNRKRRLMCKRLVKEGMQSAVESYIYKNLPDVDKSLSDLIDMGIPEGLASRFKEELVQNIAGKLQGYQSAYREFIDLYKDVSKKHSSGLIDKNEAVRLLGFEKGRYYGIENKKYPFAKRFVYSKKDEPRLPLSVAESFADASFSIEWQ